MNINKFFPALMLSACAMPAGNGDEDASVGEDNCVLNDPMLASDVENCGVCGNNCQTQGIGDKCVDSQCICTSAVDDEGNPRACDEAFEECKLGSCAEPDPDSVEVDPEAINCEFDHQCHGNRLCVRGVCSEIECADMNGDPQIRSCYTGAGSTYENPPCHKGYTVCFGGHWGPCLEEALPVAERGLFQCDGLDNDCDNCPDGNWVNGICVATEIRNFDIQFVYDQSGSMNTRCENTKAVMGLLSEGFNGNNNIHFGIDIIPYSDGSCEPGIYHHFSTFAAFQLSLDTLACGVGGSEPSWDSVLMAADNIPMFDIEASAVAGEPIYSLHQWREDAIRVIILLTDEQGQSWDENKYGWCDVGPNSEQIMCSSVVSQGIVFAVVTLEVYFEDFDECTTPYLFQNTPEAGAEQLLGIFEGACGGF